MSYLRYLCLFAHIGVQHTLGFCFVFLRLVYPMLPVSLDCLFSFAPSVFSIDLLFSTCRLSFVRQLNYPTQAIFLPKMFIIFMYVLWNWSRREDILMIYCSLIIGSKDKGINRTTYMVPYHNIPWTRVGLLITVTVFYLCTVNKRTVFFFSYYIFSIVQHNNK